MSNPNRITQNSTESKFYNSENENHSSVKCSHKRKKKKKQPQTDQSISSTSSPTSEILPKNYAEKSKYGPSELGITGGVTGNYWVGGFKGSVWVRRTIWSAYSDRGSPFTDKKQRTREVDIGIESSLGLSHLKEPTRRYIDSTDYGWGATSVNSQQGVYLELFDFLTLSLGFREMLRVVSNETSSGKGPSILDFYTQVVMGGRIKISVGDFPVYGILGLNGIKNLAEMGTREDRGIMEGELGFGFIL